MNGSWGTAINSSGHVVGWAGKYKGQAGGNHTWEYQGFLYTDSLGLVDLSTLISNPPPGLDRQSIRPVSINDYPSHVYGQILINSNVGAFVLTPDR
jgi:probable HAF family extracellular repeat protein